MRNLVRRRRWAFVAVLFSARALGSVPGRRVQLAAVAGAERRRAVGRERPSAQVGREVDRLADSRSGEPGSRRRSSGATRVFLTLAVDAGRTRVVPALDRRSGKVLWEREAWNGAPGEEPRPERLGDRDLRRPTASGWWRSSARAGCTATRVDGEPLWSQNLGRFPGQVGHGRLAGHRRRPRHPELRRGRRRLPRRGQQEGRQGRVEVPRTAPERGGWTTPVLVEVGGGKKELVVNGEKAVTAYDPSRGSNFGRARASPAAATRR